VNAPLGPKTTINAETQRYSLQKDHLIVETISVLRDIPFGESFRVEGRWNVTTSGKNLCRVILKVGVYFSKRVFLRGTIEEKTIKESAESYKIWLGLAKEEAKKGPPIGSSTSGSGISLTGTGRVSPQTSQILSDSPNNRSGRSSPSKVSPTTSAITLPSTIGVTSTKTLLSKPTTTTTPSPSLLSTSAADFSSTKPSTTRGFLAPVLMIVSVVLLFWVLYLTWRVSTVTSKLAAFERLLADDFSHHHSVTNEVGMQ
jgi:hypothetical protein